MGSFVSTLPVTTWSSEAPTVSTASTSVPVRVYSRTSSRGSSGTSTIVLSHSYETRMSDALLSSKYRVRASLARR